MTVHPGIPVARDEPVPERHPAVSRFVAARRDATTGILVINAPAGTGRRFFARGWCDDADVTGIGAGSMLDESIAEAESAYASGRRHAFIATTTSAAWAIAEAVPCIVANARDLMLTESSIRAVVEAESRDGADVTKRARRIYRATGGWLAAVQILAADPDNESAAADILTGAVIPWILSVAPRAPWAGIVQLSVLDDAVLDELRHERGEFVPTIDALHRSGIAHQAENGDWFVPHLVREVVTDWARMRNGDDLVRSTQEAVAALERSGHIDHALDAAVRGRAWATVSAVLFGNWAELFTSNPRRLGQLVSQLPRAVQARSEIFALVVRVLSAAGREQMHLPLPSIEPDYARDATAQHLRARVEHLNRRPNLRALAFGMLELSHLRLSAHFTEAGDAAALLRTTLDRALDGHRISGVLASLIDVHSGISLHLDDRQYEAFAAYDAGRHWASSAGHAFMSADSTSKLALLSGHTGDTESLQHWLAEHDRVVSDVAWGRRMVTRSAVLARGMLAVDQLDTAALTDVISGLPRQVDTDEFWPAQMWLFAVDRVLAGAPHDAITLLHGVRADRQYASRSALARRTFAHAALLAQLALGDLSPAGRSGHWPEVAVLDAVRHIAVGETDSALAVISVALEQAVGKRHRDPLRYLSILIRCGGDLDDRALTEIRQSYRASGQLGDLIPLHLLGQTPALEGAGIISAVQRERLCTLPALPVIAHERPQLTPRETEILDLLRRGRSRRDIAQQTHRSENTVKTQLRGLYRKLGATSRDDALAAARRLGF